MLELGRSTPNVLRTLMPVGDIASTLAPNCGLASVICSSNGQRRASFFAKSLSLCSSMRLNKALTWCLVSTTPAARCTSTVTCWKDMVFGGLEPFCSNCDITSSFARTASRRTALEAVQASEWTKFVDAEATTHPSFFFSKQTAKGQPSPAQRIVLILLPPSRSQHSSRIVSWRAK